jgi:hypothetical protein
MTKLLVVASTPISTYAREVYDVRDGWNVFSFKVQHPNVEMIGSLRLTEHGYLPLVYVRGAGIPALGEDGQPFVYRLRHIDPENHRFDSSHKDALVHLVKLMKARALDVPLREDEAQRAAVRSLIKWTNTLSEKIDAVISPLPATPRTAPLQAYQVETYSLEGAEIVTLAANDHLTLDCRIIETDRGFLPASHLESAWVSTGREMRLQPSGEFIMIPPGANSSTVSAVISETGVTLAPTAFYADPQQAAIAAVLELKRTARSLWWMHEAGPEEVAGVKQIRTWAEQLNAYAIAEEFIAQRLEAAEPTVL